MMFVCLTMADSGTPLVVSLGSDHIASWWDEVLVCDMFFYETSYGYIPGSCIRDKGAVTVAGVKDQMELFEITRCTWRC